MFVFLLYTLSGMAIQSMYRVYDLTRIYTDHYNQRNDSDTIIQGYIKNCKFLSVTKITAVCIYRLVMMNIDLSKKFTSHV